MNVYIVVCIVVDTIVGVKSREVSPPCTSLISRLINFSYALLKFPHRIGPIVTINEIINNRRAGYTWWDSTLSRTFLWWLEYHFFTVSSNDYCKTIMIDVLIILISQDPIMTIMLLWLVDSILSRCACTIVVIVSQIPFWGWYIVRCWW